MLAGKFQDQQESLLDKVNNLWRRILPQIWKDGLQLCH